MVDVALPEAAVKALASTTWGAVKFLDVASSKQIRVSDIFVEIARIESRFVPTAHNTTPPDDSYGLWQINMYGPLGPERKQWFGISANAQLYDPVINAKAAKILYDKAGFDPWSSSATTAINVLLGRTDPTIPGGVLASNDTLNAIIEGGLGGGVFAIANAVDSTPLDVIKAVLGFLTNPGFWKRVGIAVLGAAVIIAALAIYNKDTIVATGTRAGKAVATSGVSEAAS